MDFFLEQAGLGATVAIFVVAAVAVWISGTALSRHADAIAHATGLGHAFTGMLLLGAATSLPELATTVGASIQGYPSLAGTNLLGSIAMQLAVLAFVDGLALRGRALTHFSATPAFLMQGVMLSLLLALTAAAIAVGEIWMFGPIGFWSVLLAGCYVLALRVMYRYEHAGRWEPAGELGDEEGTVAEMARERRSQAGESDVPRLALKFSVAALVVLVSGYLVASSGARLTRLTGLDETLVGATLVAIATSLPEVSTTWSAVRIGSYALAVGNILGTNAFNLALFLPADAFYVDGTIMGALDGRSVFLAALAIVLTCIYLWGVLERRDRTVLGFGIDSAAVLIVYAAGMFLLYAIS